MVEQGRKAIFSLGSNDPLARKVVAHLGVGTQLGKMDPLTNFKDLSPHVRFAENVRRADTFLIQSLNVGPNESHFDRLLYAVEGAYHASAGEITAVVPYFECRQDRKTQSREAIPPRAQAISLEENGLHRIITMDLHASAVEGFFRKARVDHLYARPAFIPRFREFFAKQLADDNLVVVSPDTGGVGRANSYARRLMERSRIAVIYKERRGANTIEDMFLLGDVKGRTALIVDDIYDTCGTIVKAAQLLVDNGAQAVYAAGTHGVFSDSAYLNVLASPIKRFFVTDTIRQRTADELPRAQRGALRKIEVVSVAQIFANAIELTHRGGSLSALFDD